MTYSIETEWTGVTCITLHGVLSAGTLHPLRGDLDDLLAHGAKKILLDLSDLRRIDTSGVGLLLSAYKRCRASRGVWAVIGLHGQPRAILKLLRLDRTLTSDELDLLGCS